MHIPFCQKIWCTKFLDIYSIQMDRPEQSDTYQMLQNVASDQGLHRLTFVQQVLHTSRGSKMDLSYGVQIFRVNMIFFSFILFFSFFSTSLVIPCHAD